MVRCSPRCLALVAALAGCGSSGSGDDDGSSSSSSTTGTDTNASTMDSSGDPSGDPTTADDSSSVTVTDSDTDPTDPTDTTGPTGCQTSADCVAPGSPVCLDNECVPCNDTPDGDLACMTKDPAVPVCAGDQLKPRRSLSAYMTPLRSERWIWPIPRSRTVSES